MRVESLALSIPFNFDLAVLKHTRNPVFSALEADRLEAGPDFKPKARLIAMRIAQLFACPVNPVGHCQFETAAFQFSLVFEAGLNVFIEIGPGFTPTGKQHGFVALILWQIKPVFGCRFHAVVRLDHPVAQQFERVTGAPNIGKRCNSAQFRRSLAQILIHICGGKPACLRYRKGLLNSSIGRVVGIDGSGVMVERGDKSVVRLGMDDPMLKRIDLAYALNMHMAQGITTDKGLVVMGSEERYLSNQRLFNVAVTRVRDDVKVITDDKEKLGRQLNRTTGDKYSALEEAGRLDVDKHKIAARDPDKPFDPGSLEGLGLADDKLRAGPPSESKPEPPRQQTPAKQGNDEKAVQPLSLPEKSKGMEL